LAKDFRLENNYLKKNLGQNVFWIKKFYQKNLGKKSFRVKKSGSIDFGSQKKIQKIFDQEMLGHIIF